VNILHFKLRTLNMN